MRTITETMLTPTTDYDLDRILAILHINSTGMSYKQKRDSVVSNFTDLDDWYFNTTIYKFQMEEIIKITMTQRQIEQDRVEYEEWVEMYNEAREIAIDAASSKGFSYSYEGPLLNPSTGTITGVVASGMDKATTITLSVSGDDEMMKKGRNAALVNELISETQTSHGNGYEMNFNGVDDPVFLVSKYTDGFEWDFNSPYDYIFLHSDTYNKVVTFSELSISVIGKYMREKWFKQVMFSDAIARYKEKNIHGRLSASRRLNTKAKEYMLHMKKYILLMGAVEINE